MKIEISEDGFINMLRVQNGGAIVEQLDRELIKGIGAICDHGGTSEITLKIKVKRIPGMETAVVITPDVIAKHPKEDPVTRSMFITVGNGVSDQQQEQKSLGLGEPTQSSKNELGAGTNSKVTQFNRGKNQ